MVLRYSTDIIPVSEARSRLPELLDEVTAGATKVITRNGHASAALIAVERLEFFQELERRQQQDDDLTELRRGLDDAVAGRTLTETSFRTSLKRRVARVTKRR